MIDLSTIAWRATDTVTDYRVFNRGLTFEELSALVHRNLGDGRIVGEAFQVPRYERPIDMRISTLPQDQQALKDRARTWLMDALSRPRFTMARYPAELYTSLYVGNTPYKVEHGYWLISGNTLSLPVDPGNENFPLLDRLCVLGALARRFEVHDHNDLRETIMAKLNECLKESALTVYSNVIAATSPPSRIALNSGNYQVAAELNGQWRLPSGAPVEVSSDSWITLDI